MPRTVPSQIVAYINGAFGVVIGSDPFVADIQFSDRVATLVRLVDELPPEFLTMSDDDSYTALVHDTETMRGMIAKWNATGKNTHEIFSRQLGAAITDLRRRLTKLDDQWIPGTTPELLFIKDDELRDSLRSDVSAARQAFVDHEWKGSTVLAGAVVEALLHWSLTNHPDTSRAFATLQSEGKIGKKIDIDLDYWTLETFQKVAAEVGLIKGDTIKLIELAQNFRNLIHPGRANRTRERCTLSTAHTALGAMERLIEQFS